MAQTSQPNKVQEPVDINEEPPKPLRSVITLVIVLALVIAATGVVRFGLFQGSTSPVGISNALAPLAAPQAPSGAGVPAAVNMGMPNTSGSTSITTLQAPLTAPHMKTFTLVAQNAILTLGNGLRVPAWTFNGVAPGPTLRVQQGDLVVVHVVNHLSFGITVHWHGIDVPNSQDGVAGLTQNAIQPNQTDTYRFFTNDPGTYWYHSHQFSDVETEGGLFGMLIVDPTTTTIHADVDYSVALHEWNIANNQSILTFNSSAGTLTQAAAPGQWVRLRIVDTSNTASTVPHLLTLIGAPFKVVSLDGHDLNGPQWLNGTPIPIGTAQRYDLLYQQPANGAVSLVVANEDTNQQYLRAPALVIGQGTLPATLPAVGSSWFDLTTYGQPVAGSLTLQSHFDVTYNLALNNQMGTSLGRTGMTYTINGKVFPNTGMLMVKEGQLVEIQFDNQSNLYHPMHLHGHSFYVLAHNGKPLTGSPVRLDTVLVPPHSTYDIAFVANNPGIWMLHCHNFLHANWGMDTMLAYYGYTTPYTVGTQSGNFPD